MSCFGKNRCITIIFDTFLLLSEIWCKKSYFRNAVKDLAISIVRVIL